MKITVRLQSLILKLFIFSISIFSLNVFCFAQDKIDLEVNVQSAAETVRGGEKASYTIIIKNIGSDTATDIGIVNEPNNLVKFISYSPSKGNCRLYRPNLSENLYCSFGNIDGGETVNVTVEIKIADFGDVSIKEDSEAINKIAESLKHLGAINDLMPQQPSLGNVWVSSSEGKDINQDNNRTEIFVNLMPSLNIPPHIEIISPKEESEIIKSVNKASEVTIKVKAFDPDGNIERVVFRNQNIKFVKENNQIKYILDGKKYPIEEVKENYKFFRKYFETDFKPEGNDIYTFTFTDLIYGLNIIHIGALDNGGRETSESLRLTAKGDAEIEIISPKETEFFSPNSTIVVETVSKINDPKLSELRLIGTQNDYYPKDISSIPFLQQVSKEGNVYKNKYVWKNVPAGIYRIKAILFNELIPTNFSEQLKIVVTEPRIVEIFSLQDGQEFEEGQTVKISVKVTDTKGEIARDKLELFIDEKSMGQIYDSWTYEKNSPNKIILDRNYGFILRNLEKGIHTIKVVARHSDNEDGVKIGESKPLKIKIK